MSQNLVPFFLLVLATACSIDTVPPTTGSNAGESQYTWGTPGTSTGNNSSSDEDTGEAADTADTSDTGDSAEVIDTADTADIDTGVEAITATVYIWPKAKWNESVSMSGCPTVSFLTPANISEGEGFDGTIADTDSSCGYVQATITYIPGQVITTEAKWNDGVRDRFLAEKGNVVNSLSTAVLIGYSNGCLAELAIDSTGTDTAEGGAYWHSNWDSSGGELYLHTPTDTSDCSF